MYDRGWLLPDPAVIVRIRVIVSRLVIDGVEMELSLIMTLCLLMYYPAYWSTLYAEYPLLLLMMHKLVSCPYSLQQAYVDNGQSVDVFHHACRDARTVTRSGPLSPCRSR